MEHDKELERFFTEDLTAFGATVHERVPNGESKFDWADKPKRYGSSFKEGNALSTIHKLQDAMERKDLTTVYHIEVIKCNRDKKGKMLYALSYYM